MTQLNAQTIINYYLYGQETTPENKVDANLIRPEDATTTITVDGAAYMQTGGTRV